MRKMILLASLMGLFGLLVMGGCTAIQDDASASSYKGDRVNISQCGPNCGPNCTKCSPKKKAQCSTKKAQCSTKEKAQCSTKKAQCSESSKKCSKPNCANGTCAKCQANAAAKSKCSGPNCGCAHCNAKRAAKQGQGYKAGQQGDGMWIQPIN